MYICTRGYNLVQFFCSFIIIKNINCSLEFGQIFFILTGSLKTNLYRKKLGYKLVHMQRRLKGNLWQRFVKDVKIVLGKLKLLLLLR